MVDEAVTTETSQVDPVRSGAQLGASETVERERAGRRDGQARSDAQLMQQALSGQTRSREQPAQGGLADLRACKFFPRALSILGGYYKMYE